MKNYEAPTLEEVVVELDDIIATSGLSSFGDNKPGDYENPFPWSW